MLGDNIKAGHVFLLLALFWGAWLYTEVSEYIERRNILIEVREFVAKGDRFTSEDGAELEKRIEELEKR